MDIVSRLKLFLRQNGIANSQFADTCDIPRPTLSQLLNGRNKKVSDEVITKIHRAYPALNIMWLMFGDGDMFVPNANTANLNAQTQPAENSILSSGTEGHTAPKSGTPTTINFGDSDTDYAPASAPAQQPQNGGQNMAAMMENLARAMSRNTPVNPSKVTDGRRIVNIMVFYSDNSFESFTPNR